MSDIRNKLSERIAELESKIETLGAEINSESEAVQSKKSELEKASRELKILLGADVELEAEGL